MLDPRLFVFTIFLYVTSASLLINESGYTSVSDGENLPLSNPNELSFVLFYTSWCKECYNAKSIFHKMMEEFANIAHFDSADCWSLKYNCSKTLSLRQSSKQWPALFIRYGRHISIFYEGEWKYDHLVTFVEALTKPIERLYMDDECTTLLEQSIGVVLGVFPYINDSFRTFVKSAIKWLEYDPERNFRFAVKFKNNFKKNSPIASISFVSKTGIQPIVADLHWNTNQIIFWLKSKYENLIVNTSLKYHLNIDSIKALFFKDLTLRTLPRREKYSKRLFTAFPVQLKSKNFLKQNYYEYNYCDMFDGFRVTTRNTHDLLRLFLFNQRYHLHNAVHTNKARFISNIKDKNDISINFDINSNRSAFVNIFDAKRHQDFLDQYSLNKNETILLIFDQNNEKIYVGNSNESDNLLMYMHNFLNNLFKDDQVFKQISDLTYSESIGYNVQYVSGRQLLQYIYKQNQTILALFISPKCELSAVMSQTLNQLPSILGNFLKIIRLDIKSSSLLQWELKTDKTPILIIFPKNRKKNSRVFPSHLKFNIRNILTFVFAHLEPLEQIEAVLFSCKFFSDLNHCILYVRNLLTNQINHYLTLWQKYDGKRDILFQKLKSFKEFSFEIAKSVNYA